MQFCVEWNGCFLAKNATILITILVFIFKHLEWKTLGRFNRLSNSRALWNPTQIQPSSPSRPGHWQVLSISWQRPTWAGLARSENFSSKELWGVYWIRSQGQDTYMIHTWPLIMTKDTKHHCRWQPGPENCADNFLTIFCSPFGGPASVELEQLGKCF